MWWKKKNCISVWIEIEPKSKPGHAASRFESHGVWGTDTASQWRRELTPYSQKAHLNYLRVGSFWGHSVSSQWTHKMSWHLKLAVRFLWVCNLHRELIPTTAWWAHWMISQIAHSKLTMWVANSRKAHCKLTVWVANSRKVHSKLTVVIILWVHCEVTECPQNEPTLIFKVNSQSVRCKLKFFIGLTVRFFLSC